MTGSAWYDVHDLVAELPKAMVVQGADSPVCRIGRAEFARLRWDQVDRQLLQTWSADLELAQVLAAEPDTFPVVQVYASRLMVLSYLDRLHRHEVAELLLDSYRLRAGRRGKRVDEEAFFAAVCGSSYRRSLKSRRPRPI